MNIYRKKLSPSSHFQDNKGSILSEHLKIETGQHTKPWKKKNLAQNIPIDIFFMMIDLKIIGFALKCVQYKV